MNKFGGTAGTFVIAEHGALWRVSQGGALYADFLTQGDAERGLPEGSEWSAPTELHSRSEAAQNARASS
jgi:hypothetical protein